MTNVEAVDIVNAYLWKELRDGIGMQLINGLIPFVPTQDSLEFSTAKQPYITFSWSTRPDFDTYFQNVDTIVYTISGLSRQSIFSVQRKIFDLLKREDDAADDINSYVMSTFASPNDQVNFDFKNIRVITSSSPQPSSDEGERLYSEIVISSRYTIVLDNNGLRVQ